MRDAPSGMRGGAMSCSSNESMRLERGFEFFVSIIGALNYPSRVSLREGMSAEADKKDLDLAGEPPAAGSPRGESEDKAAAAQRLKGVVAMFANGLCAILIIPFNKWLFKNWSICFMVIF